jgi:hypothetical protein
VCVSLDAFSTISSLPREDTESPSSSSSSKLRDVQSFICNLSRQPEQKTHQKRQLRLTLRAKWLGQNFHTPYHSRKSASMRLEFAAKIWLTLSTAEQKMEGLICVKTGFHNLTYTEILILLLHIGLITWLGVHSMDI